MSTPSFSFLPSYILALLHTPIKPKPNPKHTNRLSRNPPLSILTHPNLPKSPTQHNFTHKLPQYLNNIIFVRNGSGIYTYPHKSGPPWIAHHLLDGIAVTHSLTISTHPQPTLTHTSDFVDHHFIQSISNTPHTLFAPVQMYHPPTLPRTLNFFAMDVAFNILYNLPVCLEHIPTLGTVARSDVSTFQQIDPRTLSRGKRIRFADLNNQLRGQQSASHGITVNGFYYNYVNNPFICHIFCISPSGETKILARLRTQTKLTHAITATENYIILPQCPYTVNIPKFLITKSVMSCVRELPREASFILVDRHKGGVVAEFSADPFFMFHFINAYEDGDNVVIDTCAYQDTKIIQQFRLDNLAKDEGVDSAIPTRFVLRDVSQARKMYPQKFEAEKYALFDACLEFPTVNPDFKGRKNRYAYGIGDCERQMFLGELVKMDMETGEVRRWGTEGVFVGEPVFVRRGNASEEDDGCLLVVATQGGDSGEGGGSALVVIDAKSMKEISRAELGFSMAIGFHASAVKS